MSAQVIPFPVRRTRPLGRNELPAHWGQEERTYYLHVTYDGFESHESAFAYCEAMSQVPGRQPGEHTEEWHLRRAQAAVRTLLKW